MDHPVASSPTPTVIYEDDSLLVLNKLSGWHATAGGKSGQPSLAAWLLDKRPESAQAGLKREEAGLIHRLDYESSGCLLAAKNRSMWLKLRQALKQEAIEKSYIVLLEGPAPAAFSCNGLIGSPYRRSKKVRVYLKRVPAAARVLPARSDFTALASDTKRLITLAAVSIAGGRRHQIRAHAAAQGFPLYGDQLYGSKGSLSELLSNAAVPAFILHAAFLKFRHPLSGALLEIKCPDPWYLTLCRERIVTVKTSDPGFA